MDIIVSLLVAVHVIVCLLLVVIVLMQRPKQEGLGAAFGGGVTDQMFGAQTTDVLQKGTVWLSVMFFVITMVLAILVSKQNSGATGLGESLGTSEAPAAAESNGLPTLPKGDPVLTTPVTVPEAGGDAKPASGAEAKAKPADSGAAAAVEKPKKKENAPAKPAADKPVKATPAGEEKKAAEGASN